MAESVYFNGDRYTKSGNGKYYYKTRWRRREALHRAVWSFHNGPIPKGWHVHHIDHNRDNNDISNLACWDASTHAAHHADHSSRTPHAAIAAAPVWHGSPEGRAWHSVHGRKAWAEREPRDRHCDHCGKVYQDIVFRGGNRFCSSACKAAARRASGVDDQERWCECGIQFTVNRYAKTQFCSRSCAVRSRN